MIERTAGRGLVLAPSGRVLMMRGEDPDDPGRGAFWFTPGGGLDPGETLEDGTRRELLEELGIVVETLGPAVMARVNEFPMAGEWYRQRETVFLVEVADEFEPAPRHLEELELSVITEMRWLGVADLRASTEPIYPVRLADLVATILDDGPPDPPWSEDLTAER